MENAIAGSAPDSVSPYSAGWTRYAGVGSPRRSLKTDPPQSPIQQRSHPFVPPGYSRQNHSTYSLCRKRLRLSRQSEVAWQNCQPECRDAHRQCAKDPFGVDILMRAAPGWIPARLGPNNRMKFDYPQVEEYEREIRLVREFSSHLSCQCSELVASRKRQPALALQADALQANCNLPASQNLGDNSTLRPPISLESGCRCEQILICVVRNLSTL